MSKPTTYLHPRLCDSCGTAWSSSDPDAPCHVCSVKAWLGELTLQAIVKLDEYIVQNHILLGIKLLMHETEMGMSNAIAVYSWRYHDIRHHRPEAITSSHQDYWDGFYS